MENFLELNLNPAIAESIREMGFDKPTPIQAQALPVLLTGDTDFLGLAATGTGKTAAFGIPLLQKIQPGEQKLQAVVLCPTRELAIQTARGISSLGKHLGIEVPAIYGGGRFYEQREALRTAPIIVATPGRLIDHLEQGNVSLETIKTLVLDEADEMISMGFEEALETILAGTSRELCRKWLFSATLPAHLKHVAETYLTNPKRVSLNTKQVLSGTVQQIYYTVRDKNKARGLCKIIDFAEDFYGLIFVQTKLQAQELAQFLRSRRYHVDSLHGDKEQAARERTLAAFRTRQVNVLVCTDVAARGLDVSDLTHVVNFSLPMDLASYVHRIGRTGRGGKQGVAISLVEPGRTYLIPRIEKRTGVRLEHGVFPSKKAVSAKMLHRYLPRFAQAQNAEKAQEILDATWKATLEGMTKEEIASRFLALALPELFEDDEMDEREPKKKHAADHRPVKKPLEKKHKTVTAPKPAPVVVEAPVAEMQAPAPLALSSETMPTVEESGLYLEASTPVAPTPVESNEVLEPGEEIEAAVETPIAEEATIELVAEEAAGDEGSEEVVEEEGELPSKPFGKKPFGKKPFGGPRRDFGDRPYGRKPFGGPRRDFGDRPYGRKPFGGPGRDFPRRPFGGGEGGEGRPYTPRPKGFMMDGEEVFLDRKPIERKEGGSGKPFARKVKSEGVVDVNKAEREYGERRDRKPFGERREFGGDRPFARKPFGAKPFGRRPFGGGEEGGEGRPFRKPFGAKPFGRRPFGGGEGGEGRPFRKPFGGGEGGEGRPFRKPFGAKPFGRRPFGGGEEGGEGRPFRKPFGAKPFGRKPFGAKKPFGGPRKPHHDQE